MVCKYSLSDAMGLFNSCVTASIKFDCRWFRRIAFTDSTKYSTTPTSTSTKNVAPIAKSVQYIPECSDCSAAEALTTTQPTVSATTSTMSTTPSATGQRIERREIIFVAVDIDSERRGQRAV